MPDVVPHRAFTLFGVLALLLRVTFRVLELWPLKIIADVVTALRGAKIPHQSVSVELLTRCDVALPLIVGLYALSNYLIIICFALAGSRAATSSRAHMFRRVQGLSQRFHTRNHSVDAVRRIVGNVTRVQEVVITTGLSLMASVATLLVIVVVMFVPDPPFTSAALVAVVAFAMTSGPTSQKITIAFRQTRKGEGQLANTAQESLVSTHAVQACGPENLVEENFTSTNHMLLWEGVWSRCYATRLERITDIITSLVTAIVLADGGLRVAQGVMSPGDLVLFATYLRITMEPPCDMARYTDRITWISASGEQIVDPMEVIPDAVTLDESMRLDIVTGVVRFDRVVAEYNGVEASRSLCLDIRPGERVTIVGPPGAGKSTLVLLLMRAIDPVSGYMRLGRCHLTGLDLTQLRANVFLLHQEAVLSTDTIRKSIRMGRGDATDAEVGDAARTVNIRDFITEQSGGCGTVVEGRGDTPSGGQWQRIATAQALLCRPPIVVLDEVTTGFDPEAASLVLDIIDCLAAGRITLAVIHDAEVTLKATWVMRIEDGRVRFDVIPEELVATSGVFQVWVQASGCDMDSIRVGGSR